VALLGRAQSGDRPALSSGQASKNVLKKRSRHHAVLG
jgi:hypothetical protein